MSDEVVLLDFNLSMFGIRVRIALAEKGIKYEHKEEDLVNTKSALLLQMNPIHKKIPVLIHNDPYQRAQARFWADFVDKKVHEVAKKIWTGKVGEHEKDKEELIVNLKQLEEVLGDKPYFGGDTFGFLDVAFIPFHKWFYSYETVGELKVDCPKLNAWAKRCLQRESVSKYLSDEKEVYEFVLSYRKKIGVD
ncbi:probable glutathione S-transferase isoform X2 [Gastrolobium bilobum]|uniref:probable glutathione S-transferase isoform X2 n=1 Tax=Gastrolobium bilobum TaxID=150636 RepID=UPI002AB29735|nr:probable glutathione S-transferase isoform X2 [Gastrolobium bilobum]